jgi:uncharacterized protein (TIGR02271 family)
MKTVVGLYDDLDDARHVITDLVADGFARDDISLIARNPEGETGTYGEYTEYDDPGERAAEGAAAGALTGGVVGGLAGVLVGLGGIAIPGLGALVVAGPVAAALAGAGIGAVAGGIIGALVGWGIPEEEAGYYVEGVRRGGTLVAIKTDESRVNDVMRIMNQYNPVDVEERSATWRASGWTGYDPDATSYADTTGTMTDTDWDRYGATTTQDKDVIPVVEEDLRVGKREVDHGRVRVHSHVVEEPVEETVELREEHVNVERRPANRPADARDWNTFEDRTIEMSEMSEEAVADKRARVVEEVELSKDVDTRQETIRDTVRRTEVDIDRDTAAYGRGFREHYNKNYASTAYDYTDYEPAYNYGYRLRGDQRYANRDWNSIEPEARVYWEQNYDSPWEDFKDAVRHAWNRVDRAIN